MIALSSHLKLLVLNHFLKKFYSCYKWKKILKADVVYLKKIKILNNNYLLLFQISFLIILTIFEIFLGHII